MLNKLVPVALLGVTARLSSATIDDICGYAPLCGDSDGVFSWTDGNLPNSNDVTGAEIVFEDCCNLRDSVPQESCQITSPNGEANRTLTADEPICGDDLDLCNDDECSELFLQILPTFIQDSQADACCDSCTCFGDPQCISFDGTEKMWVLCDGRDAPHDGSIFDRCRITEDQCDQELDHAGNQCTYISPSSDGRNWQVGKLGSPCVPNEDSPASLITMYSVPDVDFEVVLEQGERGIIQTMYLELSCGNFVLDAARCLEVDDPRDAWSVQGPDLDGELPDFFSFVDLVHGRAVGWSVVDPDSGIAMSIRCHANTFDTDPNEIFVPRLNIEDLADPVPRRPNTDGFCVSGEFDTGLATTENTEFILEEGKCQSALDQAEIRDIHRAMCKNPALPTSGYASCVYHFCSEHYVPLYSSIAQCEATFEDSLAEGFCRGIVYTESDVNKCIEQWFDLGAVETIQQYYDDQAGCTDEFQETLEQCQSGVIIQYLSVNGEDWIDAVGIPDDFCSDADPIRLNYCDHPLLFERRIRVLQKSAGVACGPTNQCKAIDAFRAYVTLWENTPTPTIFPTFQPTSVQPPTLCPDTPLCDHTNEYVDFNNGGYEVSMNGCCPNHECPPTVATPPDQDRWEGTMDWYCGEDGQSEQDCEDDFELDITVSFTHDEDDECCLTCKCFGDPRCYSFDGTFEEFILCDGRTPGEEADDRCIIRKDTCEEQFDHEGNQCAWTNPNQSPPDLAESGPQNWAENNYQVSLYGSPCRYDTSASSPPLILLYSTDSFELVVRQGERGYIQAVYVEMANGDFEISADDCLDLQDWEATSGEELDGQFTRRRVGNEILWSVYDAFTKIEMEIRCTGHLEGSGFTTTFINVDALLEPDNERAEDSDGFCASSNMPEKELASTSYTDELRSEGLCDNWNELASHIVRREVARIITNTPGVTANGLEQAFEDFCSTFYAPFWGSVSSCRNAFLNSDDVGEIIRAFCRAVTFEVAACRENLEIMSEEDGYKSAFAQGYELYVKSFDQHCEVNFNDLPEELIQSEETCETGVELQWFNANQNQWRTYAAFPDSAAPCSSYSLTVSYNDHPVLFENPVRLQQKHNFEYCTTCKYASTVEGSFYYRD